MTQLEIITKRTMAIKFYGPETFAQIVRVAEKYMTDNNIQIPSDGVTSMPSFWATVDELIREDSK